MERIIRHPDGMNPFTGEPMGNENLEFLLPVDRESIATMLPQSFDEVADCDTQAAAAILKARYRTVETLGCQALANRLLAFQPVSLFLVEECWLLRCCLTQVDDYTYSNNIYLLPSMPDDELEDLLEDFSVNDVAFAEFMTCFAGLRDSMPPNSGGFTYDEATLFSDNRWSDNIAEEDQDEWMDAYCLYYAPNGDILLLNDDGNTAWFYHAESRIEQFTETFEEFLGKFIDVNERFLCGFDAYSSNAPHSPR